MKRSIDSGSMKLKLYYTIQIDIWSLSLTGESGNKYGGNIGTQYTYVQIFFVGIWVKRKIPNISFDF